MVSSDKGTSYRTVDPKPYSWTGSSGEYRADSVATIQQQWLDCLLNNLIPDGKCALATKFTSNKVCLLDIDEMKATCMGLDLPVAINPCNADIAPDAKPAIVGNTGGRGRSNGNPDSVTIIDVEDDLTRVIDHVAGG